MFAQQEQYRLAYRIERHHFEATIQGLMTSSLHHSSSSVFSQVEPFPVPVHIGQYYTPPSVTSAQRPHMSSLFPSAQADHHCEHRLYDQYQSSDVHSQSHSHEPQFLTALTKTSHCSKFKTYSIAPYSEWVLDYLITMTLCPPEDATESSHILIHVH
jgi:hypothetical protein